MLDVLLLALALSMDAFAVSLGLGTRKSPATFVIALWAALYFGLAQGLMPLLGFLLGKGLLLWLSDYANGIAFVLLLAIGAKMLYESFQQEQTADNPSLNHKLWLLLAIATSIDAMAAGFSLNLLPVQAWLACVVIALVTAVLSAIGVYLGKKSGSYLEGKAERLGGLVLIALAFKFLLL